MRPSVIPGARIAMTASGSERDRLAPSVRGRTMFGQTTQRPVPTVATEHLHQVKVSVPEQAGNVTQRYMFMETLFHELSHSLGPGSITVGGRKTTVDQELKDIAGGFEEAKADVMGAYNVLHMMDKGVIPANERPQIRATYVAGLFRAMRFGTNDAHGKGAAMQYRYLRDKGAIVWDARAKRFRIDEAKIDAAIRDLVGEITLDQLLAQLGSACCEPPDEALLRQLMKEGEFAPEARGRDFRAKPESPPSQRILCVPGASRRASSAAHRCGTCRRRWWYRAPDAESA